VLGLDWAGYRQKVVYVTANRIGPVLLFSLLSFGCNNGSSVGLVGESGSDSAADSDSYGDTGSDTEADAGADSEADAGSDADGDGDSPPEGDDTPSTDADSVSDSDGGPVLHVFLLLGQSNMAGYPKAELADRTEDDRIRVLGYDNCSATGREENEWDVASPPLHACWSDAIGPGDYFAKAMIDHYPPGDSVGLVPCAIPGEKIETFLRNGGSKYEWIVQRATLAQQADGMIEGILFHQGESNNGDPDWPGKVNALVEDLKTDLELGDLPFLAGELLHSGGCAGHNTLVHELPNVVKNAHVISADRLEVDPADTAWNLHFGHDAQVELGKRYAEAMIRALGL
jgi:hypothetical protein